MDALDNIDLDDMFADEGDALFDGLDIDLGNMDDLAADNNTAKTKNQQQQNNNMAAATAGEDNNNNNSRARRVNKRKPVFFDDDNDNDDNDEEYIVGEAGGATTATGSRKRGATTATKKRPATKKNNSAATTLLPGGPSPPPRKKGKSTSPQAPQQQQLQGARGSVAAAGQFGGRNKKGNSFGYSALPKATASKSSTTSNNTNNNKSGTAMHSGGPLMARATSSSSLLPTPTSGSNSSKLLSLDQVRASHPGLQQSSYCGLLPSHTMFYPFMSALPNEPSLKNRKIFPMIDRVHSTFQGLLSAAGSSNSNANTSSNKTPLDTHPIVTLLKECCKEDNSKDGTGSVTAAAGGAVATIAATIGETRQIVSVFDKHRLAGDWMAICALLQRQHDFLRQNRNNMEQWCKTHWKEQDFTSVFVPSKKKRKSVLASFTKNPIKVKIVSDFVIMPPTQQVLLANIRPPPKPRGGGDETLAATGITATSATTSGPKSKKRKLANTTANGLPLPTSASKIAHGAMCKSYVDMKPILRRKTIMDLVGRCARELESKYGLKQQVLSEEPDEDRNKLVDDDPNAMLHTADMWEWLQRSGYFAKLTESDCRERLNGLVMLLKPEDSLVGRSTKNDDTVAVVEDDKDEAVESGTYIHRLQSLLVPVEIDDGECDGEDKDDDDDSDVSIDDCYDQVLGTTATIDLSQLTLDERSYLHLRSIGLLPNTVTPQVPIVSAGGSESTDETNVPVTNTVSSLTSVQATAPKDGTVTKTAARVDSDELDCVIDAMITDLAQVNRLNHNRTQFLQSMAQLHWPTEGDLKAKNVEASLIARCQQLLKKSKQVKPEVKPKSVKNDEYALPW